MSAAMLAAALAAAAAAIVAAELERWSRRRTRPRPGEARASRATAWSRRGGGRLAVLTADRPAAHLLAAAIAGCVGVAAAGPVPGFLTAAAAGAVSKWLAQRAGVRRRGQRERATPAFARSLADALRGGASVRGALAEAARDRAVPAALRADLLAAEHAIRLGAPLDERLRALAQRGGAGLRLTCGAIAMHVESGGALARELERLAEDGEAALRIDEDRVAATAQARATVRVVAALPVLALLGAEAASGSFVATIAGNLLATALLALGITLEVAAILAARVIVGGAR